MVWSHTQRLDSHWIAAVTVLAILPTLCALVILVGLALDVKHLFVLQIAIIVALAMTLVLVCPIVHNVLITGWALLAIELA